MNIVDLGISYRNIAFFLRLEILLNGTVHPRGGRGRLRHDYVDIRIRGPTYADSGDYKCSAFFSAGTGIRSVSAGSLRVYSRVISSSNKL